MTAIVAVTLLPLCGALFSCGCTLRGGAAHCNVHHPGDPHCPWCAAGAWVVGANFAAIVGAAVAAVYAGLRWRWKVWAGVAAGALGYFAAAAVVGYVTARALGYPLWFGVRL